MSKNAGYKSEKFRNGPRHMSNKRARKPVRRLVLEDDDDYAHYDPLYADNLNLINNIPDENDTPEAAQGKREAYWDWKKRREQIWIDNWVKELNTPYKVRKNTR